MSDIYPTGEMDPFIRTALDQAATVREIYRRVANVQHPDAWHPLQVVCENCGKLGTTIVDRLGRRAGQLRVPARSSSTWATGCGHSGWVSPFGGRAKLPWNLEWAAQWSLFGVTIEPCGKDLSTAGGSRDRSDAIAREVFEREPPLNVPYEFINIGGKKMSTSKGLGAAAHEIVDVIQPEQLRFFFLRPKPNHAVDFDPIGTDAVPRLYDEFDRFAAATAGKEVRGEIAPGFENTFRYSLLDRERRRGRGGGAVPARVRPPRAAAPDPERRRRGADRGGEGERAGRARGVRSSTSASKPPAAWLASYAPGQGAPRRSVAMGCPPTRRGARRRPAALPRRPGRRASTPSRRPPATRGRTAIFDAATQAGLDAKAAFAAIYLAFLGRTNGPRAGWLLASLDAGFVLERLREASAAPVGGAA